MENMERTVERIKKLMALAMSDPDTPEAKSAALKAAELLAKYELDMADLTEENKNDVLEEQFKNYDANNGNWEKMFLSVLMNVFDIHVVIDKSNRNEVLYRLFGKKQDLVLCVYFFKMIRRIAIKRAEVEYKTKAMRNSFQCGLIDSIGHRFFEMKEKRQEHRTDMTTALAVSNRKDVTNYVNELFPNLQKGRISKPNIKTEAEAKAFRNGKKVGKDIPLNTPLEGEYEQARGIS
jgi:hypothetical protein